MAVPRVHDDGPSRETQRKEETSTAVAAVAAASAVAVAGSVESTAEVRRVLTELVEREPEARSNPSVQAAYVALDNMEAEELENISVESAL